MSPSLGQVPGNDSSAGGTDKQTKNNNNKSNTKFLTSELRCCKDAARQLTSKIQKKGGGEKSSHRIYWRPGLVVTRASCYNCVFSKTRKQQEFSVMSLEKYLKPTLRTKFGDYRRQYENVMPQHSQRTYFFTSPSNFCSHIFSKIHISPKISS